MRAWKSWEGIGKPSFLAKLEQCGAWMGMHELHEMRRQREGIGNAVRNMKDFSIKRRILNLIHQTPSIERHVVNLIN